MTIPVKNLTVYKGQNKNFVMAVSGSSGIIDITNDTISFYIRETIEGDPIITKTTANAAEIEKTNPTKGEVKVKLLPADTSGLTTGKLYYQMWRQEDGNGEIRPILMGYFWVHNVAPSLISMIRGILDEAGELRVMKVSDEMVKPSTVSKIHTSRRRLKGVEGVWLLTDEEHTGTNYFAGGGFNSISGEIWLGTPLTSTMDYVRICYTWESGVDDETITWHLNSGKLFVENYTGITFVYGGGSSLEQKGAEAMAVARCIVNCVLSINGANVAQMGYNFRLDEFEIQTKLWGEGMIAEALFNLYISQYEEWKAALGKKGLILIATPDYPKYDISKLVGYSSDYGEGTER